jgi:hypothetical protein
MASTVLCDELVGVRSLRGALSPEPGGCAQELAGPETAAGARQVVV